MQQLTWLHKTPHRGKRWLAKLTIWSLWSREAGSSYACGDLWNPKQLWEGDSKSALWVKLHWNTPWGKDSSASNLLLKWYKNEASRVGTGQKPGSEWLRTTEAVPLRRLLWQTSMGHGIRLWCSSFSQHGDRESQRSSAVDSVPGESLLPQCLLWVVTWCSPKPHGVIGRVFKGGST